MIKKHHLLLFAVGILCSLTVQAQFSKGSWATNIHVGTMLFDANSTEYSAPPPTNSYTATHQSMGIQLTPSVGYFISNRTMLGAGLLTHYTYDKYIDESNNITFRKKEDRIWQYGVSLFARHYVHNTQAASKFLPFVQVNADAGSGTTKVTGFNYTSTYKETYRGTAKGNFFTNLGLQAGVTRLFTKNAGLDISAGYLLSNTKSTTHTRTLRDIDFNDTIDEEMLGDLDAKSLKHGFKLSVGWTIFF